MKIWIVSASVILLIAVGIVVFNQTQVEAQNTPVNPSAAVIIHCAADSRAEIKVVSSAASSSDFNTPAGNNCAFAVARLTRVGFKIQSSVSDTPGAFSYTLLR